MAKQDAAAVNTAGSGTQAPTLNFTTADIKGMSLTSGGALVITKTDGSSVTIENFKDLSQQGAKLTLADGQTIDTQKLFDTLSATGPLAETSNSFAIPNVDVKVVTLGLPQAGQTTQVTLEPGQTYVLGFDPAAAQTSMEGGNLVISFADGAKLIIAGFADVMGGSNPPVLTLAEGRVIDGIKLLDMARMNDMADQKQAEAEEKQDQQNIAQIAEELAKVEPAAGEAGGAAAANRGGFGYQSAVEAAPLGAPAPVGPLGPTALAFGLPEFDYAPAADVRVATPSTAPSFETEDVQVKEDGSVLLAIEVSSNGVPNVNTTATITGIPSTWTVDPGLGTYDPATGTWTITLLGGGTFSGGPILHPPADSDVDLPNLVVTVTNTNITTGAQTSVTGTVDVTVDAVADKPLVDGQDNSGLENTALAVSITGGVTDTDSSETIVKYVVSGVPAGFSFSDGTNLGGGQWEFTPNQLLGLTATSPANYFGSVPLTVTVYSKDSPTDNEFDLTDNTNQATDPFTLTWKPVVNPPSIEANLGVDDAFVKEDGSIFVAIKAALDPEGSGNEILTVTVTGISADWTITNADGTYNAATGTWTITLPAGQNYNGGLTFAPPANSDVDLTGLVATATAFEPASGTSAQATDDFRVITDAVIDEPTLTVSNSTGSDNAPIALNIATQVGELDGSETITHLTITGVPAGATLSAGTYNAGTDTWTLSRAELTGLTMTPVRGVSDVYTLTVTTFAQETNLSGIEYDLTDNNAQKSATLTVTVRDDLPKDLKAPAVSVDETTLHTTPTVTVTNTLTANFGSDTPGSFAFTGTGPTGLTSNGAAVDVALVGNTYTGSVGGETIFTLTLNPTSGQYTFNLTGVLDHPEAGNPNESMALNFGVKATDADGDFVNGTVTVNVFDDAPTANDDINNFDLLDGGTNGNVITGANADNAGAADLGSKDLPNKVTSVSFGGNTVGVPSVGEATIKGDHGTLTIKADGSYTYVLDSTPTPVAQDYNVAMMLDVSGSMGNANDPSSKMALLLDAVQNLMADFNAYPNGTINVHIVPFGTDSLTGRTFNVSDPAGLQAIITYLEGLNTTNGLTNYEAPLQDAAAWLQGVAGNGGTNLSYFISDGEPNRYLDNNGNVVTGNLAQIMNDLNGSDGSNDIGTIQGLGEVIAVGINISNNTLNNLNQIDTGGNALNVQDPNDLSSALAGANPIGGAKPTTDEFEYVLTDADGDPSTATLTLNSEAPTILPPSITVNNGVDDVIVKEDGSVFVKIVAALDPTGPAGQILTVTVTGVQPGWTITNADGVYNPTTGTWTITLAPNTNYNGGLTFKPAPNSDVDLSGLNATAKATEPVTGLSASKNDAFKVITDAVADKPHVDAPDNSGLKNTQLAVNITAGLTDTDGSETITGYKISGDTTGVTFSAGTKNADGTWSFTPAEIVGLKATAANFVGSKNFTVTVFNGETNLSGNEPDSGDNSNSATDPFKLTWNSTANPPTVTVTPPEDPNGIWAGANADDIWVKEDGSVFVNIDAKLAAGAPATEILTVTVTGVKEGWVVTDTANHGWTTNGNGTWTITLAPGQNYDGGLTFTPPANSDRDLTDLVATAVAYEPSTNTSANANDPFAIFTDAVIDAPNLTAQNANGSDNGSIALTIATSVTDTDGSESITKVVISGVPSDASLSAGVRQPDGTYLLTPAQLNGLSLTPARGFNGDIKLTVTSTAKETTLAGNEHDLRDNETSKSVDLTVRVVDGVPTNLVTPGISVDETNLAATGQTTASGTLSASFGNDAPGSYAFTGTGPTGLTSGGKPVTVALSGTTYTATADGKTIFTLTLNAATGKYDFKLVGTLDHSNTADHNDAITLNFGVKATDADGDAITGTVAVKVYDDGLTANDDFASVDASIRVVSGSVTPNDSFSQDVANKVSAITFGSETKAVSANGETTINGANGTLVIKADGTYTYTLHANAGSSGSTTNIALKSTDVAGTQTSVTLNGVTISIGTPEYGVQGGGDLVWVNQSTGQGVGISSGSSEKVWPAGEKLVVNPSDLASTMKLTLSDMGNNVGDTINLRVFTADGQSVVKSFTVSAAEITNNNQTFTINSTDVGGKLIDRVEVYSPNSSFMLKDVGVTYPGSNTAPDQFTYTLKDGDGDTDTAVLTFNVLKPTLIVGENVDDKTGSTTPYEVGTGTGIITGGAAGDILVGDVGGSSMQNQNKNYNVVMMLDVSGSMSGEKIAELRDAVKNLLADLNNYQGGTVTIHMVPFGSHVYNNTWGTFTLQPGSTADDYQKALNYVNALQSYTGDAQYTNYEAPLQKANEWLANDAPKGVDNYAYFVSDGEPNRYLNGQGQSTNGNSSTVMGQITGSDGSNEVAILKGQTVEVIGVGIGVNNSTLNNISVISDKPAIDVQDPDDLSAALQGASPLNQLANVGNDVLTGGDGSDIIYGDSINTDALALANGVNLPAGSGWAVFTALGWNESQIVSYIKANAEYISHESVGSGGSTRGGGNDTIYGGAGDDIIFGQEGNDHIYGGAGNDTLYGGSGADTFHYTGNDGHDTIKDFNIAEGDVLDLSELLGDINGFTQAAINDFVFATTQNGNTVISVDVTGSGNVANAQAIATLQGVATTDLNDLLNAHTLQTNV